MEEYQANLVKRHAARVNVTPWEICRTGDITCQPLGSSLLLVVQCLYIFSVAHEDSDRSLYQRHVDGIYIGCRIVIDGQQERLCEVALRTAGRTAGGILANHSLEGSIREVDAAAGHHTDGNRLVILVDGTLDTLQQELFQQGLIVAYANLILQLQVAIGDAQRLVSIQIDVVAQLKVSRGASRKSETGNLHVALLCKGLRDLDFDETLLMADGSLELVVEFKRLYQTRAADTDAARMVVVAGSEPAEQTNHANDTIYRFHIFQL